MRTEIDLPNLKGTLRPGMYGQATLHLGKGDPQALRVPQSSVVSQDIKKVVYVVRDGKAYRTLVQAGQSNDREVEVLSGLKPGDAVVVNPRGLVGDVVPVEVENRGKLE
jgi:hypothetical protein